MQRLGETAMACALIVSGSAQAGETIKYRFVSHSQGVLTMDAADSVAGHIIGAAKFSGIVTLEDGPSGLITYLANIDNSGGAAPTRSTRRSSFPTGRRCA